MVQQLDLAGRFTLPGTAMILKRVGYGAMQLAGPQVWGPPRDVTAAITVLRAAVDWGVNHIDTSDFYGPHVTNQLIKQALHPYPDDLVIVTKVGARRGADKSWLPALSRQELIDAVHDNLRNLQRDTLDVVNLRVGGVTEPSETSIAEPLTVLAELKRQGLVGHIGLSNVTPTQVAEGQSITGIVCVQNLYNVAQRNDDRFDRRSRRARDSVRAVFPAGRLHAITVVGTRRRSSVAAGHADAAGAGLAPATLAQYPADSGNVFARASSRKP